MYNPPIIPETRNNSSNTFLFLNKNCQIRYVATCLECTWKDIFNKGFHVFEDVTWRDHFISAPNQIKEVQTLYTLDGKFILYLFNNIIEPFDEIYYVISLFDTSDIKKLSSSSNNETLLESDLIMTSDSMKRIQKIIYTISNVDSTVFLLGESGVGKSAIANRIHQASNRSNYRLISINCGAIPESLIEAELFGYEDGTFTGGIKGGKIGLFEAADKGTIFLDEIAELPLNLQSKLLSVLQEGTIRRIGSTKSKKIDVRVIAATNNDIKQLIRKKLFREDLYYRLNVVPLTIPPLRERKEEIQHLIDFFLAKYNKKYGLEKRLSISVKRELMEYQWPGNIRELENMIERIVVTNIDDEIDHVLHPHGKLTRKEHFNPIDFMPLKKAKKQLEKELILKAVNLYGNTYKAAEALGIDQSTISKKMKLYRKGEI
ncbi:sigma-54 interaction domain-containing protein [Pseudalkalibacillus decolorationis]|uniref:sigma-54 interaction domain-containing protein n=1 Tax=Pseudalkalibacillus decolorationis TaxID=163879 RepID=UPI0021497523|nr:sigma 54-interacting transcriptional regulator [Pseudalkalibacillus decolorationis]